MMNWINKHFNTILLILGFIGTIVLFSIVSIFIGILIARIFT